MQILKFRPTAILTGVILGAAIFFNASIANATGCSLNGTNLNCTADGKSAENIMQAFASKDTKKALSDPLSQKERFKENGSLEQYRSSMERNWRIVTRLARQQERNRNRGRISEAQFQAWAKNFSEAKESYKIALSFYRQLHWQGFK